MLIGRLIAVTNVFEHFPNSASCVFSQQYKSWMLYVWNSLEDWRYIPTFILESIHCFILIYIFFFQGNSLFVVLRKTPKYRNDPHCQFCSVSFDLLEHTARIALQKIVKEKRFIFRNLLVWLLVCNPLLMPTSCPVSFRVTAI